MSRATGLWEWAVDAYARPGVELLLLELQDRGGHSVPYLLWVAWMAGSGRAVTQAVLADGAALARDWDTRVIGPLRHARRSLRGGPHTALRDQIKAVELEAERALLTALEARADWVGPPSDLSQALALGAQVWVPAADAGDLDAVARLLS